MLDALRRLSRERPVFHAEADFQHAFAWCIQREYPDTSVRLERPYEVDGRRWYVDVVLNADQDATAIELKYKTRRLEATIQGEAFRLKDQGAQDIGRYDFFKDVARIEQLIARGQASRGLAMFLTNDSSYWKPLRDDNVGFAAFSMHQDRTVQGCLEWGERAGPGTRKNREESIIIEKQYRLEWTDFSQIGEGSRDRFRTLCLEVAPDLVRPTSFPS